MKPFHQIRTTNSPHIRYHGNRLSLPPYLGQNQEVPLHILTFRARANQVTYFIKVELKEQSYKINPFNNNTDLIYGTTTFERTYKGLFH